MLRCTSSPELRFRLSFYGRRLILLFGWFFRRLLGGFFGGFRWFSRRILCEFFGDFFRDFLGKLLHKLFVGCHRGPVDARFPSFLQFELTRKRILPADPANGRETKQSDRKQHPGSEQCCHTEIADAFNLR